jgi:hypothetical protein
MLPAAMAEATTGGGQMCNIIFLCFCALAIYMGLHWNMTRSEHCQEVTLKLACKADE